MYVKESDRIDAAVYVVQAQPYRLAGSESMLWVVLVLLPMPISSTETSTVGDLSFVVIIFLGCFGFLACGVLLSKFYYHRHEKAIIQSDWRFTCSFLLGCTMMNLSTFTLLGPNVDQLCCLRMWSFHALVSCGTYKLLIRTVLYPIFRHFIGVLLLGIC
jgi:hypothetical protein